jgi:hypothetical protein
MFPEWPGSSSRERTGADVMKTAAQKAPAEYRFYGRLVRARLSLAKRKPNEYAARAMELLETLARETRGWIDPLGKGAELFPVVNLSLKISAFYSQMDPAAPEEADCPSSAQAATNSAPGEGGRRLQLLDMESYAQKKTAPSELFKQLFYRAGIRRLAARRDRVQAYCAMRSAI